jgi:hypothetical protein
MDFYGLPIVVVPCYWTPSHANGDQNAVLCCSTYAQDVPSDRWHSVVPMPANHAVVSDSAADGHKVQAHISYLSSGLPL